MEDTLVVDRGRPTAALAKPTSAFSPFYLSICIYGKPLDFHQLKLAVRCTPGRISRGGVDDTPAGEAIEGAPNLTKIGGNDNTVLFPHPPAFSHASGTRVPDSGVLTVWFRTNCYMNLTTPATYIANGLGDIRVEDAWYGADNEITAEPERKEVGR